MESVKNQNNSLTDAERIKMLKKEEKTRLLYENLKTTVMKLSDLTKGKTNTYSTYQRDQLRTYLKNPASEGNQKNLRKLSNFLYTVSHVYRRLIAFKAQQIKLNVWNVYPKINIADDSKNNSEKILKNYDKVVSYVNNMGLDKQILKCMLSAWKNDVVYGFCYGNPEKSDEFFIHLLDPDFCKISGESYSHGVLSFAFDFSFFNGQNKIYLDIYDPIFKKMYANFEKDNKLKWQELPIDRTFCLKINIDNLDYPVPPLSGLFDSLISLADLQAVQDIKDELEAYKLVYAKINTLKGATEADDFEIDLDLAVDFYEKLKEEFPDNVALGLSPMELQSIDFDSNGASDVNMISKAYENIVNANGGIVLNHNKITNSKSFMMALQFDSMDAMAPVSQINAWVNLWIQQHLGNTGMIVEFNDISPYFIDDRIDRLLKVATYSIPCKLELASLVTSNPVKERGMSYMEKILGLGVSSWNQPLVSSNVQSGIEDTKPEKDEPLSDEGERTRDGEKNSN